MFDYPQILATTPEMRAVCAYLNNLVDQLNLTSNDLEARLEALEKKEEDQ